MSFTFPNPCSRAIEVSPKILKVRWRMALWGGSRIYRTRQPSYWLMSNSILLNGSGMLALLGTLIMCGVSLRWSCHAPPEVNRWVRLFIGWCLPLHLMVAILAASLSHSCMYCSMRNGRNRIGAIPLPKLPKSKWMRCCEQIRVAFCVVLFHVTIGGLLVFPILGHEGLGVNLWQWDCVILSIVAPWWSIVTPRVCGGKANLGWHSIGCWSTKGGRGASIPRLWHQPQPGRLPRWMSPCHVVLFSSALISGDTWWCWPDPWEIGARWTLCDQNGDLLLVQMLFQCVGNRLEVCGRHVTLMVWLKKVVQIFYACTVRFPWECQSWFDLE